MGARPFSILSICTGVGGLELGLGLAVPTAVPVCHIEREAYCCEVLVRRMQDGIIPDAPVWTDAGTFDGRPWLGKVDCISASMPCQPFSKAGTRRGDLDGRYLWPHVRRIIGECGPQWVFLENVSNHLRVGFRRIADDLRGMGFRVAAGLFSASEVGAPHLRQRVFALAHSGCADGNAAWFLDENASSGEEEAGSCQGDASRGESAPPAGGVAVDLLDDWPPGWDDEVSWELSRGHDPSCEPTISGVADGLPERVDRCRAVGNAVLPVVAAFAFRHLAGTLCPGEKDR